MVTRTKSKQKQSTTLRREKFKNIKLKPMSQQIFKP